MWIADTCRQLNDGDRAELECDAARNVFETLGAGPALAQLDGMLADQLSTANEVGRESGRDRAITDRELQVLRLAAVGRTNREIAGELAISEKTVERHLGNIFTKLGVANRTAASARAHAQGLL